MVYGIIYYRNMQQVCPYHASYFWHIAFKFFRYETWMSVNKDVGFLTIDRTTHTWSFNCKPHRQWLAEAHHVRTSEAPLYIWQGQDSLTCMVKGPSIASDNWRQIIDSILKRQTFDTGAAVKNFTLKILRYLILIK